MDSITTIEQLIHCFQNAEVVEQEKILKNIDIPTSKFREFASWSDGRYTRNCLARSNEFEFVLLCWDGNCKTKIHDHDGQDCWVYQVDGNLREIRYDGLEDNLKIYSDNTLSEGDISFMNDQMGYHRIENPSDKKALTLHIYVHPIVNCKVYNENTSRFEIASMSYDSVLKIRS